MALRIGSRTSSIQVDGDLERFVREVIDATAGEVAKRFEAEAEAVYRAARRDWPRKGDPRHPRATGRSKAALETGLRVLDGGEALEGYVLCDVPYAKWIMTRRHGKVGNALIRRPMAKAGKAITRDLGDDIVRVTRAKAGGR